MAISCQKWIFQALDSSAKTIKQIRSGGVDFSNSTASLPKNGQTWDTAFVVPMPQVYSGRKPQRAPVEDVDVFT